MGWRPWVWPKEAAAFLKSNEVVLKCCKGLILITPPPVGWMKCSCSPPTHTVSVAETTTHSSPSPHGGGRVPHPAVLQAQSHSSPCNILINCLAKLLNSSSFHGSDPGTHSSLVCLSVNVFHFCSHRIKHTVSIIIYLHSRYGNNLMAWNVLEAILPQGYFLT